MCYRYIFIDILIIFIATILDKILKDYNHKRRQLFTKESSIGIIFLVYNLYLRKKRNIYNDVELFIYDSNHKMKS